MSFHSRIRRTQFVVAVGPSAGRSDQTQHRVRSMEQLERVRRLTMRCQHMHSERIVNIRCEPEEKPVHFSFILVHMGNDGLDALIQKKLGERTPDLCVAVCPEFEIERNHHELL